MVPFQEVIAWAKRREGYVIGDFGCGEALLAAAIGDRHVVHSFDHVAINDRVLAGDMAHTPLENESLDVAVFSLSLMGANFTDYWVYVAGPLVGATIAVGIAFVLRGSGGGKAGSGAAQGGLFTEIDQHDQA